MQHDHDGPDAWDKAQGCLVMVALVMLILLASTILVHGFPD
jgi:hypothetical protein